MIVHVVCACVHISLQHTGVPSVPVQITEPLYEYGSTNFNVSLNWIPPHGNHQIDYYRLRINGQSHTIINGTSHIINFLPYSKNITAEIDIVNCAGEGAESTAILTKGIYSYANISHMISNSPPNLMCMVNF